MKIVAIDTKVLGGQGCIGAKELSVPNPAPSIGPTAGVDATLGPAIDASATTAAASAPTVFQTPGGPHTSSSQYSTIGPIPQG